MINDGKSFDESLNEAIHPFNDRLNTTVKIREPEFSKEAFWMKVIFSSIFCIAALYVIITRKYDDETKKWAFSVLTLIAGVWIGTATK